VRGRGNFVQGRSDPCPLGQADSVYRFINHVYVHLSDSYILSACTLADYEKTKIIIETTKKSDRCDLLC
jgi:hypothetical protein